MDQAIDPVCKMTVDTQTAQHKSEYGGTTYYFCAPSCKKAFDKEPQKYLNQEHSDTHPGHSH